MAGTQINYEYMNKINGTVGDDILVGTAGHDEIVGDAGDDMITGNGGDDAITGGAGRDVIHAGSGNDTIFGDGVAVWDITDTFVWEVQNGKWDDVIYAGAGNDDVEAGIGNDIAYLGAGDDVYTNSFAYGAGAYAYYWYQGSDTVYGEAGNDIIEGHRINGGTGNDTLTHVRGYNDTSRGSIVGGAGNDTIYVSYKANISAGPGNDTVYIDYQNLTTPSTDFSSAVTKLGASGLLEIDLGSGNDTLTRVAGGKNEIRGGAGNDIIKTEPVKFTDGTPVPKSLGGDDFIFMKGDARQKGDQIFGFRSKVDDLDFTHYDKNGDGIADLRRSEVKLTHLGHNVTKVEFNHEVVTVYADHYLIKADLLFA